MFDFFWTYIFLQNDVDKGNTVEPVLKAHSQNRWSLMTGLITLRCRTCCHKYLVFQDRWSLMAVVSQDMFHCTNLVGLVNTCI